VITAVIGDDLVDALLLVEIEPVLRIGCLLPWSCLFLVACSSSLSGGMPMLSLTLPMVATAALVLVDQPVLLPVRGFGSF
jgi:hypothetical protein